MKAKTKLNFGVALALTALALSACSYSKEKIPTQKLGSRTLSAELLNSVSFSMVKSNVFDRYNCTGCHANRGDIDFNSYNAVKPLLSKIEELTLNANPRKRTMPKGGATLSPGDQDILAAWVQGGGRLLSVNEERNGTQPPIEPPPVDTPPPVLPPVPVDPTFKSISDNIFTRRKCDDCHLPFGSDEDVDIFSLRSLLDPANSLVVPGDPDKSILVQAVLPGARRPMPPKKGNKYSPLTEDEINVIKEWIKNGAKD